MVFKVWSSRSFSIQDDSLFTAAEPETPYFDAFMAVALDPKRNTLIGRQEKCDLILFHRKQDETKREKGANVKGLRTWIPWISKIRANPGLFWGYLCHKSLTTNDITH